MAALSGKLLRVKIGNGGSPETFAALGGARADQITSSRGRIDVTNKDTNDYQTALDGYGVRAMSLSVSGIFNGSASEERLRVVEAAGSLCNFQVAMPNGGVYQGAFYVENLQFSGGYNDTMTYSATINSSGTFTYTPPA